MRSQPSPGGEPVPAEKQPLKPHWFQILLSIAEGPLHGTAIMEEVLERTDGEMKLWPGTLYGSLRTLESEGLVRETDPPEAAPTEGGKRRFYALTPGGRLALCAEVERLSSYVRAARGKGVVDGPEPA
jgi:DNA-binding PadR family transcriptional regulator